MHSMQYGGNRRAGQLRSGELEAGEELAVSLYNVKFVCEFRYANKP